MSAIYPNDPFLRYIMAQPNHRKISITAWALVLFTHALVFAVLIFSRSLTTSPQLPESLMVEVIDATPTAQVQPQPAIPEPVKPLQPPKLLHPAVVKNVPKTPPLAATPTTSAAPTETAPVPPLTSPPAATNPTPNAPASATNTTVPATTAPRFDAAYLDNPAPKYPAISRRLGEQGLVKLRVFVESNGKPAKIELFKSSKSSRLDQTAIDTVGQWKFIPAKHGNENIADWVIVPIHFSLNKE